MNRSCSLLFILTTAFCLSVPMLAAAPPAAETTVTAVDITGLSDGDYILTLKAGVPSFRPLRLLTPGVVPTPTPIPVPTPVNSRSKLFQDAASKVAGDSSRDTNAKQLAALYRSLSGFTRPNGTTPAQITNPLTLKAVTSQGTDALLPPAVKPSWQPVRDLLGTQWTLLDAKNDIRITDYADLLDDAATGLEASAPQKSIDPATLQMIIQLILTILKLFFPMG